MQFSLKEQVNVFIYSIFNHMQTHFKRKKTVRKDFFPHVKQVFVSCQRRMTVKIKKENIQKES